MRNFIVAVGLVLLFLVLPAPPADSAPLETRQILLQNGPHLDQAGNEFYVSPSGSPSGDGSIADPWDLQTALSHPAALQPGDTIWLRGGTYTGIFTSTLIGTESNPITVRSYPGEWAAIDTYATPDDSWAFTIDSQWTHYQDLEFTNSRLTNRGGGIVWVDYNNKFINNIVHDMGQTSYYHGPNEIYGCLFYNNGVDGDHSHQLYTQNRDTDAPAVINDSIIFHGFGFGVHAYSSGVGLIDGVHLSGNIWFNNGVAQTETQYSLKDNVTFAGIVSVSGIVLRENMGWASGPTTRSLSLGRYWENNHDITLTDNYLVGETWFVNPWEEINMAGNTFLSLDDNENIDPAQHPDNTYLTTPPTSNQVFIRPNQYDPDRAHIAVYNWEDLDQVDLNPGAVLQPGDQYEIRSAQDYFGDPVSAGTYTGEPITLPMTGLDPVQPIGWGLISCPEECTGKAFNVFVLIRTGQGSPSTSSRADFDGDGDTDISVYRPSLGNWYIYNQGSHSWGLPGDLPAPGDFDGNGSVDIAVFRPSNGKWYIKDQGTINWGTGGDVPLPCDYNGDGMDEIAVYRPSNGNWYIQGQNYQSWGFPGDIPVPADYDGNGACDIAVFRPANGKWYIPGNSPTFWAADGDIPVPGDYDGDGAAEIAVFRPSNGNWYVTGMGSFSWGLTGDIPVPGDYDGDGDWDLAVLRPANGKWYIRDTGSFSWYLTGDFPLPVRDTNADGDPYH